MKNFVSIIIPTYNEEKNIENALKSIRNQDYKHFEIIVSDSKSKDKTRQIAKKYGARLVIDDRKGIGAGRNFGAKYARGNILLFLDADTTIPSNTVSEFAKCITKANVVGVVCPVIPFKMTTKNMAVYLAYNQFVKNSVKTRKPYIAAMCIAYKKKYFLKINGFNENLAAFEDIDLSSRIAKFGKIIYTENTFATTSPRRIEKWGHFSLIRKYFKFYIKYRIGKKIKPHEYKPVRTRS